MKNKKIILGLGTITALGAMSVGFIACVKEKEVKKIVDEAGYSKLTEDQVKEIVGDKTKGLSKLTEDQVKEIVGDKTKGLSKLIEDQVKEIVKKLISENKDSKILAELFIKTKLTDVQTILTSEIKKELAEPIAKDSKIKYSDIGHFADGTKKKDLINKINQALKTKGWEVVVEDKAILEQNADSGNNNPIAFKLKKTVLGVEIVTSEDITFNYSLGKYNMEGLANVTADSEINDITDVIKELNKREEFKNIQIDSKDVELDGVGDAAFKKASYKEGGFIKLKSKTNSKKVTGKLEIKIPQLKRQLTEAHLGTGKATLLNKDVTIGAVINELNKHADFTTNEIQLTNNDITIEVEAPTYEKGGLLKIKSKPNSQHVKGEITLTIPKLQQKDLSTLITSKNLGEFKSKPDANAIIEKLKKLNPNKIDDITITDYEITVNSNNAVVVGKKAYKGTVTVTFTVKS